MNEWMDGWVNEWMKRWVDMWMQIWMDGATLPPAQPSCTYEVGMKVDAPAAGRTSPKKISVQVG